jgi:Transposase DDE domain
MGISTAVSRSTLADANETRGWRIHADFAPSLIAVARKLYAADDFGVELSQTVYAFDATTIDLCLSVFPWARFQTIKSAVKLHTLLDLRGNIPSFLHITDGKGSDYKSLDVLPLEAGSLYIMDRGYIDFARLDRFNRTSAFFVIRQRANNLFRRVYSHPVDTSSGSQASRPQSPTRISFAVLPSAISKPASGWLFSPTTLICLPSSSLSSIAAAGRSNCSSSGSSNTCASRPSTAHPKTLCVRKSGSLSQSMSSSPSSRNALQSRPVFTQCYRSSASHTSRKYPCIKPFSTMTTANNNQQKPTN